MGKIETIEGDILKSTADFIVHQCYCTNVRSDAEGLAKAIFEADPSANVYEDRVAPRNEGSIAVRGRFVAFFAQYYPGGPREQHDHSLNRRFWFYMCINRMFPLVQPGQTVAFPELIGCGLAQGDPEEYAYVLRAFAMDLPDTCTVQMYRWKKT